MKRYQKVKNEWGETEDFLGDEVDDPQLKQEKKAEEFIDRLVQQAEDQRNGIDNSKHITPVYKGTNEPTLKGALTLVIILCLIGFASCYGLFWVGFLHV